MSSQPPVVVDGRYRVIDSLGKGGMGEVLLVEDGRDGDRMALKRLRYTRGSRQRQLLRFRREFHTVASLAHPGIVRVFDFGIDGNVPYYTMELLEGGDLKDHGVRPLEPTCATLRDVASALSFLHARRLLHRDLSLGNVRLTEATGRAKLIDFGVMSTVGVTGEVVGTPPYVAPETILGLPLDHRADLYALGALAYRALVGRHAYPARSFDELRSLWKERPASPSVLRPEISPPLDELVMSLLSLEPLARPTSAAEVIDRLEGMMALPPQPDHELARGWLQSNVLVGREEELGRARRALSRLIEKPPHGAALVVEGDGGMGKSRMIQEIGLEAQTVGATLIRVRAGERQGPYQLLRDLSDELLASCREDAEAAAAPHLPVLMRVIPALAVRRSIAPAAALGDPAEDRIRLQREAVAWIRSIGRNRPLVISVDDVQRADEGSAALLASLAHASGGMGVLIVAALRGDEPARAPAAMGALADAGFRLRLHPLSLGQVEDLVRSTFGEGPDVAAIAKFVHHHADRPLFAVELMRKLVDDGVLTYADGLWTVSGDLASVKPPAGLGAALRARLLRLPPRPLRLAEAASVVAGELSLELLSQLADDEGALFDDLGELVGDDVLVGSGDGYRFRHDGLREALVRGLVPDRKRELHRRAARALEALDDGIDRELEIGWHHHHGDEPELAAELLERGGRRLYEAHGFRDAVAPLQTALATMERSGADRRRCLDLRQMLMRAGVICDREVILRYAPDTIDAMARDAGMGVARRLAPWIGSILAVGLGLMVAGLRHLFRRRSRRGFGPIGALTSFLALVNYTASVRSLSFHIAELQALTKLLEPFRGFRGLIPEGAYLFVRTFWAIPTGRLSEVESNVVRTLASFERDRITPLAEIDRRIARGGAHYMLASCRALDQDPRFSEELESLGRSGLRFFELGAQMDRLFFHRLRGEEDRAKELLSATEISYVQLGNAWVFESQLAWISCFAYGFCRDVIGLKRSVTHLERLVDKGYRMEAFAKLARGEYLRERGDAQGARTELEAAMEVAHSDASYTRQMILAARAEAELAIGDLAAARRAAEQAMAIGEMGLGLRTAHLRAERALALIEAAGGDAEGASQRLDRLIDEAAELASPSICGGLHEARARVAWAAPDPASFLHHRNRARSWFHRSNNPALIARAERLEQLDEAPSSRPSNAAVAHEAVTVVDRSGVRSHVSRSLANCRGRAERLGRALELLVEDADGLRGYLFAAGTGGAMLVAPHGGDEPPTDIVEAAAERLQASSRSEVTAATLLASESEAIFVELRSPAQDEVLAVAAIVAGPLSLRRPDPALTETIAQCFQDAGDISTRG